MLFRQQPAQFEGPHVGAKHAPFVQESPEGHEMHELPARPHALARVPA
jgi:hypothetical protein